MSSDDILIWTIVSHLLIVFLMPVALLLVVSFIRKFLG